MLEAFGAFSGTAGGGFGGGGGGGFARTRGAPAGAEQLIGTISTSVGWQTLANNPKLILADEPTGNLDDETGELIIELLRRLAQEK